MKSFKPLLTAILASTMLFATSNAMAVNHSDKAKVENIKTHMSEKVSTNGEMNHQNLEIKKTTDDEKSNAKKIENQSQESAKTSQKNTQEVNINTATASELQASLIGIGEKKAQAIVEYRKEHGKFTKAEQLMDVKGIGESIFAKNKSHIEL